MNSLTVENTSNERHLSNTSSITEADSAHNKCELRAESEHVTHLAMTLDSKNFVIVSNLSADPKVQQSTLVMIGTHH